VCVLKLCSLYFQNLFFYSFFSDNIRKQLEEDGRQMLQQMEETEGVIKMDNGVYVHVLQTNEGGQRPTRSSTVKVHYHGSLPDGTVFDSTLGAEPVTFPLAQVIPGWRDGLLKMREGETAMVGIPPEQGYGDEGTPDGRIPGGSTLFFKIQLLDVLSAGIGGGPSLLGADGKKLAKKSDSAGSGLVGADGKPL
jgi:peptidylprolyl isomerase